MTSLSRWQLSKTYAVYIMASRSKTLYTGITSALENRVYQHKHKLIPGFTAKYKIERLVYYEVHREVRTAIAREKQIKAWTRAKRVALIESTNPTWADLAEEWVQKWRRVEQRMREAEANADSSSRLRDSE